MKVLDAEVPSRVVNGDNNKGNGLIIAFGNRRDKVSDARATHDHTDTDTVGDERIAGGREASSLLVSEEHRFYLLLTCEAVIETRN